MHVNSKIYIAGHRGLVGSALIRKLQKSGYGNIIGRTHRELDLTRQSEVETFFEREKPEYVFLAAARVGGILANNTYKADFVYTNIMIAANVIYASYKHSVKKLLNLGSSCIYPKFAPQPMKEDCLLSGSLEPTNEPYAIAKISAIKLCKYFNEQYDTNFISIMPTNLYGTNDNFNLETSHVLPALIRKFYLGRLLFEKRYEEIVKDLSLHGNHLNAYIVKMSNATQTKNNNLFEITEDTKQQITNHLQNYGIHNNCVTLWGTGNPYREFLYVDDLADVCVFLMKNYHAKDIGEFVNVGTGSDLKIKELAHIIKEVVGYEGEITWDSSKPDGTSRKLLNIEKITKLGWKALTTIQEGIRLVYKNYIS